MLPKMARAGGGEALAQAGAAVSGLDGFHRPTAISAGQGVEDSYQRFQWLKFLSSARGAGLKSVPIV